MDINGKYNPVTGYTTFNLGEQDLFITSDISDRITFLGETVFKYSSTSSSKFTIGLERAVFKYNIKGNHSFVAGKFHTPVNYWNDSYHHGRVFFPTIGRPESFNKHIVPIHNTGIGLMGQNLGKIKLGYNIMVANGLGSSDIKDNDDSKSLTLAAHIKPLDGLRIGASSYIDFITNGSETGENVTQNIYSASISYFKKIEFLSEMSYALNSTSTIDPQATYAWYLYAGYKFKDKYVPYIRIDYLEFGDEEMYFHSDKTNGYIVGLRYEVNYLTAVKAEFQVKETESNGLTQGLNVQIAIGF